MTHTSEERDDLARQIREGLIDRVPMTPGLYGSSYGSFSEHTLADFILEAGYLSPERVRRLQALVAGLRQSWENNGDPVEIEDFNALEALLGGEDVLGGWWDQ